MSAEERVDVRGQEPGLVTSVLTPVRVVADAFVCGLWAGDVDAGVEMKVIDINKYVVGKGR